VVISKVMLQKPRCELVDIFAPVQTCSGVHPTSCTGSFPGVKWPRRDVGHQPHLVPRLKKEQSYSSTPPLELRGLLQGKLYLYVTEITLLITIILLLLLLLLLSSSSPPSTSSSSSMYQFSIGPPVTGFQSP
jgi:hypothetical protein